MSCFVNCCDKFDTPGILLFIGTFSNCMLGDFEVVLDLDPPQPLQLEAPIQPEEPIQPPTQEPLIQPPMAANAGEEDISMEEFLAREEITYSSSIRLPDITARNFEVKPVMIQMLQLIGTFNGTKIEDPVEHLTRFVQMCGNFKHQGVSTDALRLRLYIPHVTRG